MLRLFVALAGAIVLVGCAGFGQPGSPPRPGGSHSPRPSSSPTMSAVDWAAAWKKRGVLGIAPPRDLGRKIQLDVPIVNDTGGKVDDATAHRWAIAVWRSAEWENWALNANEDIFFAYPNLAESTDVSERVFDYDISEIRGAKIDSAAVDVQFLHLERLTLVPVPDALRKLLNANGELGYQYGWVITYVGPGVTRWLYADGRPPLVRHSLAAGVPQVELVAGQWHADPLIGEIWQIGSDLACDDARVRSLGGCQGA